MNNKVATRQDTAIRALRERMAADTPPEAAPDLGLVLELADSLRERYAARLVLGQADLASADLDDLVRLVDSALERAVPADPLTRCVAWTSAGAHDERWRAVGSPADRDTAIRLLGTILAAADPVARHPAPGPAAAQVHAVRARLLGDRYEDGPVGAGLADLEAAISHARAGLHCLAGADAALAGELRTVLGLLLADRYGERALASAAGDGPAAGGLACAARADRDEAIAVLELLCGAEPPDPDGADPAVVATLGQLYSDRYYDVAGAGPDPADLDAAICALSAAAGQSELERRELETLVMALADKYEASDGASDRDAFIHWGELLMQLPGAGGDYDGAGLRDLLAVALLDRAGSSPGGRMAALDDAIGHLEAELAAAVPDDPGRPGLATMVAEACWERLGGRVSDAQAVDRMTRHAHLAWHLLARPDDDTEAGRRVLVGVYLACGILERLKRAGQRFRRADADLATGVLLEIEPEAARDPAKHLSVVGMLAHLLVLRAGDSGDPADLREARPWVLRLIEELEAGRPDAAEIAQTLAFCVGRLAAGRELPDGRLEQAIDATAAVASRAGGGCADERLARRALDTLRALRA